MFYAKIFVGDCAHLFFACKERQKGMYKKTAEGWAKHFDFILLDSICLELSLYLAFVIRHGFVNPFLNEDYRRLFLVVLLINFLIVVVCGTFRGVLRRGAYQELIRLLSQSVLLFLFTTAYMFTAHIGAQYSRITIVLMVAIHFAIAYVVRLLWKKFLQKRMTSGRGDALLIMASIKDISQLIKEVKEHNYAYNRIVGVVTKEETEEKTIEEIPVVASYKTVLEYAKRNWVDEILVSAPAGDGVPNDIIDTLISMGTTVHVNFNRYQNDIVAKRSIGNVGGLQVITMSMNYMSPLERFLKRGMDIFGGVIGCLATGILYLFIAPKIKKESPGPAFFAQTRIGQNGKPFQFYKFRSMYLDAEERKKELIEQNRIKDGMMFKMEFDPRVIGNRIDENGNQVTGIGEFIRKTSIDEFPQFYNVLKGDMSLVGTRPPTVDEYEKYAAHHKARLAARPGITGLWQVSGRSDILDFEDVVKLDTQYINNWSLGLDLKILVKTLAVVLKKEGSM